MSEPKPGPVQTPKFRVEDRSDRVWVFGYLRMAPLLLFLSGVAGLLILHNTKAIPLEWFGLAYGGFGVACLVLVVGVPFILERSTILDPVDFIEFSDRLRVKRLAGDRTWELQRVRTIEFAPAAGDDYDEKRPRGAFTRVTIHFQLAWPSPRLLVSEAGREKIAAWAAERRIPVENRA